MVVWTFDPDVFDLPPLVRIRGAAGTELAFEQRFDLLQTPGFGLRQAAIDEEETQQSQAGVEEEGSWGDETKEHSVTKDSHPQGTRCRDFHQSCVTFYKHVRLFSFIDRKTNAGGDSRYWRQLTPDVGCPRTSTEMCVCWQMKMFHQIEILLSGCWSPYFKAEVTCSCQNGITAGLTGEGDTNAPTNKPSHRNTGRFNEISWPLWSLFSPCLSRMTFFSIMLNTNNISMTTSLCFFSFDAVFLFLVNESYKPDDERLKSIINHPRPPQSPLMDRSPAPRKVSSFLSEEKPAVETHWRRRYGRGLEEKTPRGISQLLPPRWSWHKVRMNVCYTRSAQGVA